MKRSSAVPLVFVTTLAASLIGCQRKPMRYCVDQNNVVVKDDECRDGQHVAAGFSFHWYYSAAQGSAPPGTRVSGGSTAVPEEGFTTPSESGTSRGVIGEAGEAAAGHGGGEAGAGE